MKHRVHVSLAIAFGVALLLVGGIVAVGQAQSLGPQGTMAPQAAVGNDFTYQGRLIQNGSPYSGTCDFRFTLYSGGMIPASVGGPVEKTGVQVQDGYFTTMLDFGYGAFTGESRQLGIEVRCPSGSGSYTALGDYAPISAAPYALSLQPGAVISGSYSALDGAILSVNNTYGGIFASYGIKGTSQDVGVLGVGSPGVQGETTSDAGVHGVASAASGVNYGVYGESSSSAGYGVYGKAAHPSGGYGVYGESAAGYGVYGKATPPDGYALYSEGNTMVNGTLFWKPLTSCISIPPAAFIPSDEGYNFTNDGISLTIGSATPNQQTWLAPVQLPQGATVTKFTFYWSNPSNSVQGSATLYRTDLMGGEVEMATASTTTSGDPTSSADDTISYAAVDNTQYGYYIKLLLRQEDGAVALYGITIEYTVSQPY